METGLSSEDLQMKNDDKRCPRGSVGAIIKDTNGRVLFILRATFPVAWACPAGHFEVGETAEQAVSREVKEETNLDAQNMRLVWHGVMNNPCRRGFTSHEWFVFVCVVSNIKNLSVDTAVADDARWVSRIDYAALQATEPGIERVWQEIIGKIPHEFWPQ